MLEQALYAIQIVAIAIAGFLAYYWGANWLLDRVARDQPLDAAR